MVIECTCDNFTQRGLNRVIHERFEDMEVEFEEIVCFSVETCDNEELTNHFGLDVDSNQHRPSFVFEKMGSRFTNILDLMLMNFEG